MYYNTLLHKNGLKQKIKCTINVSERHLNLPCYSPHFSQLLTYRRHRLHFPPLLWDTDCLIFSKFYRLCAAAEAFYCFIVMLHNCSGWKCTRKKKLWIICGRVWQLVFGNCDMLTVSHSGAALHLTRDMARRCRRSHLTGPLIYGTPWH